MASALEQLTQNYETSAPVNFNDFYNAYYKDEAEKNGLVYTPADPNSFGAKFDNFFSGKVSSAKQAYDNYLSEYEFRRNAKATSAQNELTFAREDSQVQRLLADYQKAGLNPYMLLSGGNLSSGVVSSQAFAPSYKRSSSKQTSKSNSNAVTSAIKAIALIAMMAA